MKKHPSRFHRKILQQYELHLVQVVGLSPRTCHKHLREVSQFLKAVPIAQLSSAQVTHYLRKRSTECQASSLRLIAGYLRTFLRFAQQQGWTDQALCGAVPKIACRVHYDLPVYLSRSQLDRLLASWDQSTAEGRRDRAIGLCLARLALRAGEVAALLLEDIHWREGTLGLRQCKNGHSARVPLLSEVGQAVADYLRGGRPACSHRQVFVQHQPPSPMSGQAVSAVIRRALRRCGLEVPRPGAHLLRHTLASHLVQNGASLKEVADLLRHRHLNSTSVYAHVDVPHLRALAQPWPKEVAL